MKLLLEREGVVTDSKGRGERAQGSDAAAARVQSSKVLKSVRKSLEVNSLSFLNIKLPHSRPQDACSQ